MNIKTILITGGTTGIGKGLATAFLKQGDRVIVVGSSATKGEAFSEEAKQLGAEERAFFLQADLRFVQENKRVVEEVQRQFRSLDLLILCAQAQKFSTAYVETQEGFEQHFALYYLSRYLLSYGLKSTLEQADIPIIVNVCAPGTSGTVQWEDLQLKHAKKFTSLKAIIHGSRLNDLLGVAFVESDPKRKVKYILYNPGAVQTEGVTEAFEQPILKMFIKLLYTMIGKSVEEAIQPILELVEHPPQSALAAFKARKEVSLSRELFDKNRAQTLFEHTSVLLGRAR